MCASAAASATCDREARPAASRARSVCEKASEGVRCYHLRQHRPEACHLRQSQRLRCTGCQSRQQSCEIPAPWHRGIRRTGRRSSRQSRKRNSDRTGRRDPGSRQQSCETPAPWHRGVHAPEPSCCADQLGERCDARTRAGRGDFKHGRNASCQKLCCWCCRALVGLYMVQSSQNNTLPMELFLFPCAEVLF